MTPERQKWWDSLPKEEKQVRLAIKKFETDIKWRKNILVAGFSIHLTNKNLILQWENIPSKPCASRLPSGRDHGPVKNF